MTDRYRLNLEAPFLRAASSRVEHAAPSGVSFQRPAGNTPGQTNQHLRRVPVPQRAHADHKGADMARYIDRLESRLIEHIRRHAPRWHALETHRVYARWAAPGVHHPAPDWAAPRNMLAEARRYAGVLVQARIAGRMHKLHDIRLSRVVDGYRQPDALNLIFDTRLYAPGLPEYKIRQKI